MDKFTCLNSLRDVEPTVDLILKDPPGMGGGEAEIEASVEVPVPAQEGEA